MTKITENPEAEAAGAQADVAVVPPVEPPKTRSKTPWARRREMDFKNMKEKVLGRAIELAEKIPVEQFTKHGFDGPAFTKVLGKVQDVLDGLITELAKLPDEFPAKAAKELVSKDYTEGDSVRIRANKQDKYAGAFDAKQTLTVAPGKVGGSYVPIRTGDGSQFFVPMAHLMRAPAAEVPVPTAAA